MRILTISFFLALPLRTIAWGADGHKAVGEIAMEAKTKTFVETLLGEDTLGDVASWADEVRSQHGYAWSAPLHYVDARDHPPTSCSVQQARDCERSGCILSAISNYTTRLVDPGLDRKQKQEAVKFLIAHFIGDVGQPLHVEGVSKGGNDIQVKCVGRRMNLHAVWDEGIIEQILREKYENSVEVWVESLVGRIKNGEYDTSTWFTCSAPSSSCPMVWAKESNALGCSLVFTYPDYPDLCESEAGYYELAVPVIEKQIVRQGMRLGVWLNGLVGLAVGGGLKVQVEADQRAFSM
ncbi:hypothetical protein V5O48_007575 [Marasmius crinis-equi]|uniref:Uncharacterized protein n=1 Tax=Marasmius crinis-equi TaxID=585013 RepID=A0ABR3FGB0_9AGAR